MGRCEEKCPIGQIDVVNVPCQSATGIDKIITECLFVLGRLTSLFIALLLAGGAQLQNSKSLNLAAIALYGPVHLKSSPEWPLVRRSVTASGRAE